MSQTDVEEKHVTKDKAISQEDISRPSSSIHDDVNQQDESTSNHEVAGDKEAQIDARSTLTTESAIPPPPDGGLHAWLKVFGGFMIYINIWYPIHLLTFHQRKQTNTAHPGASP
jgi:hypothetical protein